MHAILILLHQGGAIMWNERVYYIGWNSIIHISGNYEGHFKMQKYWIKKHNFSSFNLKNIKTHLYWTLFWFGGGFSKLDFLELYFSALQLRSINHKKVRNKNDKLPFRNLNR